jgi:hypothetical protein
MIVTPKVGLQVDSLTSEPRQDSGVYLLDKPWVGTRGVVAVRETDTASRIIFGEESVDHEVRACPGTVS